MVSPLQQLSYAAAHGTGGGDGGDGGVGGDTPGLLAPGAPATVGGEGLMCSRSQSTLSQASTSGSEVTRLDASSGGKPSSRSLKYRAFRIPIRLSIAVLKAST